VFVWGFTGSLPTTVAAQGVVSDGSVLCYIGMGDAGKVNVGQKALFKNSGDQQFTGQVSSIGDMPMSAAEITSELNSDYLAQQLVQGEFAVKITITFDGKDIPAGTLLNVSIVTDSVRPIDFLLK
jgi:hypothetical protein